MKLNHALLRTADMEKMNLFLNQALGLEEGFRPPFSFDGKWIYSGKRALFHLVESIPADSAQAKYLELTDTGTRTGAGSRPSTNRKNVVFSTRHNDVLYFSLLPLSVNEVSVTGIPLIERFSGLFGKLPHQCMVLLEFH